MMRYNDEKIKLVIDATVAENIEKFRSIVAEVTGCDKNYCVGKNRQTEYVKPRQMLCFVIKRIYPFLSA